MTRKNELKVAFATVALLLASASILAVAAPTANAPPDAVLANEPLFSTTSLVKPNMVLDLSVEFPTTGRAYRDARFDIKKTYIGYWDPMGCYDYSSSKGRFERKATATDSSGGILCDNKWSGNMLNWAASSAIDMLRYAMTGGDRVDDKPDSTVLQRAMLERRFFKSEYFPMRALTGNLEKLTPLVASKRVESTGTVQVSTCLNHIFFGVSQTKTSCDEPGENQRFGPDNKPGPYVAQVEVCSDDEGPIRGDLCQKYPSGKYKPVGTIQKYSDAMRFAAFGYLLDNTNERYGGVLRAPMKFTGPMAQDESFKRVRNEAPEWDAETGVLEVNPLNSEEQVSGVVSYLNRFGRTGPPPVTYKSADPVGELFYESLRYLQGQPPSPQATERLTEAMKDGFPVYNTKGGWGSAPNSTKWDPVVARCQRNYALVIGDLNTHHDQSLPGLQTDGLDGWTGARSVGAGEPNTAYWTSIVGAFENGEETKTYTDSARKEQTTRGNKEGPKPFAYRGTAQITSENIATLATGSAQGSFGWAGLAYWANTQSIRSDYPDVRVKTFTIDVDEGGDGTIDEKKRGSSFYLAAKYGGFDDKNKDGNPFVTAAGESNEEWQSGVDKDGLPRPANYFLGSEPQEMISAIRRIFAKAGAASGSIAGGALSNPRVSTNGSTVFVPQLDRANSSGSVLAYKLGFQDGAVSRETKPIWDAGELLTGNPIASPVVRARDPSTRKIFTMLESGRGAPFTWDGVKGDRGLRDSLNAEPYRQAGTKDELGAARVNYLRGDRAKETSNTGGVFRTRSSVMGDVVNSTPLLVGPSSSTEADTQVVYVGANDGMLHAFGATSGTELFAYVPRALHAKLGEYTSPDYVHQAYVDGSPVAGKVQLADGSATTVLVSSMGAGARGVFALNVAAPTLFSENDVLWEFTGDDDPDMGYVLQAPRIMRFRVAPAIGDKPATYGWFAVVASGFNNGNANKAAALFLLSFDKKAGEQWRLDTNYYKIVLPDPLDKTVANALGPVADYSGADNATRFLYAGDTQGNLWKFDFTKSAPWKADALALDRAPVMVAKDDDGNRQPITTAPLVGVGPHGNAIVLFGTGKLVEVDDLSSRRVQTLYGVYDNNTSISDPQARKQLERRTVTPNKDGNKFSISGNTFVYGSSDDKDASLRRGWYFDLPDAKTQGERQVSQMVLSDGYLLFNTLVPSPDVCGTGGGHSCAVNAMTGLSNGSTCIPSTVGLLSSPLVIEEGEAVFTSTDSFGRRIYKKKISVVNLGTGTGSGPDTSIERPIEEENVPIVFGRLNWRQVVNFKGANK